LYDSYLDAKYSCSSFFDILNEVKEFEELSSYRLPVEVISTQKEITLLTMSYLIFGILLNEYPDNFAFEVTSRLLPLYGLRPNITNLIKQCDEECSRHCALITPYQQLQAPGNGLMYTMNKHTMPVVDMDMISNGTALISLSDKIVVINMRSGSTVIDLKLPIINEPYLNSTTLPKLIIPQTKEQIEQDEYQSDNADSSDDEEDDKFKKYLFFVNSKHHVYLVSTHGDIQFQRTSDKGYSTAEIINRLSGLCLLAENQSKTIECWSLGQNKLIAKIDLNTNAYIKNILFTKLNLCLYCIAILSDGTILFYMLKETAFVHCGTVHLGQYLNLVIVDHDTLICTFGSIVPIDFVYISLKPLERAQQEQHPPVLTDNDFVKTMIAFNPPIHPKPIEKLILPEEKSNFRDKSTKIFFMALTKDAVYIIHVCRHHDLSYVCIPGQFDVVSIHISYSQTIYTVQTGIVNIYKWQCIQNEDETSENDCHTHHRYQLFVSIDISSSSILAIKPSRASRKNIFDTKQTIFFL